MHVITPSRPWITPCRCKKQGEAENRINAVLALMLNILIPLTLVLAIAYYLSARSANAEVNRMRDAVAQYSATSQGQALRELSQTLLELQRQKIVNGLEIVRRRRHELFVLVSADRIHLTSSGGLDDEEFAAQCRRALEGYASMEDEDRTVRSIGEAVLKEAGLRLSQESSVRAASRAEDWATTAADAASARDGVLSPENDVFLRGEAAKMARAERDGQVSLQLRALTRVMEARMTSLFSSAGKKTGPADYLSARRELEDTLRAELEFGTPFLPRTWQLMAAAAAAPDGKPSKGDRR